MHKLCRVLLGATLSILLFAPALSLAADDTAKDQAQRQQVQPYNNAPVWREVRSEKDAVTQVRGRESSVLIQSGGETWRRLRNGPITLYGGIVLIVVLLALGAFYKIRG